MRKQQTPCCHPSLRCISSSIAASGGDIVLGWCFYDVCMQKLKVFLRETWKNASMWVIVTAAAARWCHVFYCLLYFWTHPMLPHPGPKKIKTRHKMHDLCFYPVCPFSLKDVARSSAWRRMYPSTAHPQCFHHVWSYMVARFSFAELLRKHVKVGFWFKHVFFSKNMF